MDRNERDMNIDGTTRGTSSANSAETGSILHHDHNPSVGDEIGEAAGGISGVLTGAAIGSVGGPIGTIIGGIAGAVGGWWAGRTVSEAASRMTHTDDEHYQNHYTTAGTADRSYDDVRPAYQLGHLAGQNPDYANRSFDEVEGDLRNGWSSDLSKKHGEWDSVRNYARDAYTRGRSTGMGAAATGAAAAGTAGYAAGSAMNATERTADRVGDAAHDVGHDAARTADRVGDKAADVGHDVARGAENAWDKTKAGAERLGDKLGNAADDMKDRVDGNPNSRPGPDSTDSPRR